MLGNHCNDVPSTSSMASGGESLVKIEVLDDEEQFCQRARSRFDRLPSPPQYENASDAEYPSTCKRIEILVRYRALLRYIGTMEAMFHNVDSHPLKTASYSSCLISHL